MLSLNHFSFFFFFLYQVGNKVKAQTPSGAAEDDAKEKGLSLMRSLSHLQASRQPPHLPVAELCIKAETGMKERFALSYCILSSLSLRANLISP